MTSSALENIHPSSSDIGRPCGLVPCGPGGLAVVRRDATGEPVSRRCPDCFPRVTSRGSARPVPATPRAGEEQVSGTSQRRPRRASRRRSRTTAGAAACRGRRSSPGCPGHALPPIRRGPTPISAIAVERLGLPAGGDRVGRVVRSPPRGGVPSTGSPRSSWRGHRVRIPGRATSASRTFRLGARSSSSRSSVLTMARRALVRSATAAGSPCRGSTVAPSRPLRVALPGRSCSASSSRP